MDHFLHIFEYWSRNFITSFWKVFVFKGFGDASAKDKQKAATKAKDEAAKAAAEDAAWQDNDKGPACAAATASGEVQVKKENNQKSRRRCVVVWCNLDMWLSSTIIGR